jgi:hypothetical protein
LEGAVTGGASTPLLGPERSGVRRLVVIVTALAAALIWGLRALVALRSGAPLAAALALGGRAALFGGAGFGVLFGAVVYGERRGEQQEQREEEGGYR